MDQLAESTDDTKGSLLSKRSAPKEPKKPKQDKEEAAQNPDKSKNPLNQPASYATAEYPPTKEKRLMRKRRSTLKRRKSLSRRALTNSGEDVAPSSVRSSSPNLSKGSKKRRGSRKVKHKPPLPAEERQGSSHGRRATKATRRTSKKAEKEASPLLEGDQGVSRARGQVLKASLLESSDQDQPDTTKRVEVASAPQDCIKQKIICQGKGVPPSILPAPDKSVSSDECIRKPTYLKQTQKDSTSTGARLPWARMQQQDANTGQGILQPAHTDRPEVDDAPVGRSLQLGNAESTSEEANTNAAGHHRVVLLSPALLPNSVRDLGTSFFRSNPLVSLMRRASRFSLTRSMSESRPSRSSRPTDDEEGSHATAKSSAWRPTMARTTDRASLGGGHARALSLALTVVVAFVAVTLLAGFFVVFAKKWGGDHAPKAFQRGRPSLSQLQRLCSVVACRRCVSALVDGLLEWDDSSSCAHFGQYVCGGWTKHSARRRSFNDEALERSMERLHTAMVQVSTAGNGLAGGTDESNMALFYKSCIGFLMHEQLTRASDVLRALNISADGLRLIETQRILFRFVVRTSLRTGLPSVVSVVLRGSQLVLDAGRSLELALLRGQVEQYLTDTLKELRFDNDKNLIPAFLAIDASVTSSLKKVKESDPLVVRRLGDLNTPFANTTWTEALNALPAKFPAFTAGSYVQVRDEPLLYASLSAMSSVDVERARLYAIVVLLAQVIRYRYILGGGVTTSSSPALTYECLSTTGRHFPAVFLPWSYDTLVERGAPKKIRQMAEIMKESFRAEVGFYGADLGNWSITIVGESRESYYNATRMVTPSVSGKSAPYDEASFLVNVVRARAESVGKEWDEDGGVDRQLRASLQFEPSPPSSNREAGHVITMSAPLLADPLFIGDPALVELDYGTVGVSLLAEWLDAELRSNVPFREMIDKLSPRCPPDDGKASTLLQGQQ
ncbi:uncharacterized protein [Dermacentor albipictus]|uniref:uncharacterized protein isoform X2 n=1 Tax=Dermacentor albipictus TaxID=60249 RepID=UPI0038FD20AD